MSLQVGAGAVPHEVAPVWWGRQKVTQILDDRLAAVHVAAGLDPGDPVHVHVGYPDLPHVAVAQLHPVLGPRCHQTA